MSFVKRMKTIVALMLLGGVVGCHGNGVKYTNADGGSADGAKIADVGANVSDLKITLWDALAEASIREDVSSFEVKIADDEVNKLEDDAKKKDAINNGQEDAATSTDLSTITLPKDITVYTKAEMTPTRPSCVAAAPGWLSLVSVFLAEDQKCWSDTDCTYVSFTDSCGMICVLPINKQRIGEFGTQVYTYASANCSSCPDSVVYPDCPAPRSVYCNVGRCEYTAN